MVFPPPPSISALDNDGCQHGPQAVRRRNRGPAGRSGDRNPVSEAFRPPRAESRTRRGARRRVRRFASVMGAGRQAASGMGTLPGERIISGRPARTWPGAMAIMTGAMRLRRSDILPMPRMKCVSMPYTLSTRASVRSRALRRLQSLFQVGLPPRGRREDAAVGVRVRERDAHHASVFAGFAAAHVQAGGAPLASEPVRRRRTAVPERLPVTPGPLEGHVPPLPRLRADAGQLAALGVDHGVGTVRVGRAGDRDRGVVARLPLLGAPHQAGVDDGPDLPVIPQPLLQGTAVEAPVGAERFAPPGQLRHQPVRHPLQFRDLRNRGGPHRYVHRDPVGRVGDDVQGVSEPAPHFPPRLACLRVDPRCPVLSPGRVRIRGPSGLRVPLAGGVAPDRLAVVAQVPPEVGQLRHRRVAHRPAHARHQPEVRLHLHQRLQETGEVPCVRRRVHDPDRAVPGRRRLRQRAEAADVEGRRVAPEPADQGPDGFMLRDDPGDGGPPHGPDGASRPGPRPGVSTARRGARRRGACRARSPGAGDPEASRHRSMKRAFPPWAPLCRLRAVGGCPGDSSIPCGAHPIQADISGTRGDAVAGAGRSIPARCRKATERRRESPEAG